MITDYGKIAYLKTEDILNKINKKVLEIKTIRKRFIETKFENDVLLFSHNIETIKDSKVNLIFNFDFKNDINIDWFYELYINNLLLYRGKLKNLNINYISNGVDIIELKFKTTTVLDGVNNPIIDYADFLYTGYLNETLYFEPIYFDETLSYVTSLENGEIKKYTNVEEFISNFRYYDIKNDFYLIASIISGRKKSYLHGLYYDDSTKFLTFKNFNNNAEYQISNIKPIDAIWFPTSSSYERVVYLLNNKLYFFNMSKIGSNIQPTKEINVEFKTKVKKLVPISQVNNTTYNYFDFLVQCEDGAYLLKYDTKKYNYTSAKYLGKCKYVSGFFDTTSVTICFYDDGKCLVKKFSDRNLTVIQETKQYNNILYVYNLNGVMVGLTFNGLNKLAV